jgi:Tol biopolymer transport system component
VHTTRRKLAIACIAAAWLLLIAPVARPAHAAASAPIAFVGTDYNIYQCEGDCSKPRCLTCPVRGTEARAAGVIPVATTPAQQRRPANAFGWPTYSPDASKIAYIAMSGKGGGPSSGVYVYDLDKGLSLKLFESSTERVIYLYWLPDGRQLSFLTSEPGGRLTLMLAQIRENAPLRIVATGAPLYFNWNRAGGELLLHTSLSGTERGERVSLMSITPTSQDTVRVLAEGYAPFKAPCWSADGKHLAFVATENDIAHLYVADADGKNPRAAAKLMVGQSSFVWAPDSRRIAFSTAQLPPHEVMDGISIVDVADGRVRRLVEDGVVAFYFSPDSKQIAYVGVPPKRPYYTWNVVDVGSGHKRELARFLATGEEGVAWRYFDQLALSHNIWAPDSSAITFAGVIVKKPRGGKAPGHPLKAPAPQIIIMPVGGGAPRMVAEGVLAFWAPRVR